MNIWFVLICSMVGCCGIALLVGCFLIFGKFHWSDYIAMFFLSILSWMLATKAMFSAIKRNSQIDEMFFGLIVSIFSYAIGTALLIKCMPTGIMFLFR